MALGTSNIRIMRGDTVKVCGTRGAVPVGTVATVVTCFTDPVRFVLAEYEHTALRKEEVELVAYARRVPGPIASEE